MTVSELIKCLQEAEIVDPNFEVSLDEAGWCIIIPRVSSSHPAIAKYFGDSDLSVIYLDEEVIL